MKPASRYHRDVRRGGALRTRGKSLAGGMSLATLLLACAFGSPAANAASGATVAAWGNNYAGQLGNNSNTDSSIPVAVTSSGALSGKTVIQLSAGGYHSLALCRDGTVAAWGSNEFGELGNNGTTDSSIPVNITNSGALNGKIVKQLAAGGFHSLTFGPYPGWSAKSIACGGDNNLRALWNKTDGTSALWMINPQAHLAVNNLYGPYADWSAGAIAAGADNKMRALWTRPNGTAAFWTVAPGDQTTGGGSLESNLQFGRY